jgi:hypothetical protein
LEAPVKKKNNNPPISKFHIKTKARMPPKQNIYGSLLTGKKLDLGDGKVWENREHGRIKSNFDPIQKLY